MLDSLLGLGGSIIGAFTGQAEQARAQAAQRRALEEIRAMYMGIPLPALERLDPTLLGSSAAGDVTTDPALAASQGRSLAELEDSVATGGMTGADRAAMTLAQNEASRRNQVQAQALQSLLASRGLGSSGAAVGARLAGGREAQERVANAGLQSQVAARARALESAKAAGGLAGQMRGQQYQERMGAASARDQWARYNQDAMQRTRAYNAQLDQQRFNNQMTRAGGVAGAQRDIAGQAASSGAQRAGFAADMGTGLGQAGASIYQDATDPRRKTNYSGGVAPVPTIDWSYP